MERFKSAADALVERFHTADPFALCGFLDVELLELPLPAGIRGFYASPLGVPIVYLNSGLSDPKERVAVCAHELGHALLHTGYNSFFLKQSTDFVTARYEREADLFAGFLLLDRQTLADCRANGWTVEQVSRYTALPPRVVEQCLRERGPV